MIRSLCNYNFSINIKGKYLISKLLHFLNIFYKYSKLKISEYYNLNYHKKKFNFVALLHLFINYL
jgi:hypothetical protein